MQSPQQSLQQVPQQKAKREYHFKPGKSGNPRGRESAAARRERLDRKVEEIAREFGGMAALSPIESALAHQAAELLLLRPSDVDQRVRAANAVTRILATLSKRRGKRADDDDMTIEKYAARHAAEK